MGRRWLVGPLALPVFCSGSRRSFISFAYSPVLAMVLNICSILSYTTCGPYLRCSAIISSPPALLLFFRVCTAFSIYFLEKGGSICWGVMVGNASMLSFENMCLKWSVTISTCASGSGVNPPSAVCICGGFFVPVRLDRLHNHVHSAGVIFRAFNFLQMN